MVGPLSYLGGKRTLAKQIIALFPEHTTYVEAFGGGGQVLFRKKPSKVEVLNDLDDEIMNFFRIVREHYEELIRYFRFMLVGRKWYELMQATDPDTLTDVQRAVRCLYLLKTSFASRITRPNYHWHVVQPPGLKPESPSRAH
jgi:DNA adenine methylase